VGDRSEEKTEQSTSEKGKAWETTPYIMQTPWDVSTHFSSQEKLYRFKLPEAGKITDMAMQGK
jgi:hypothetical protein